MPFSGGNSQTFSFARFNRFFDRLIFFNYFYQTNREPNPTLMRAIKFLLSIGVLILIQNIYAQDKIILKDGNVINAYVVEKSDLIVKYKLLNTTDSPVIVLRTNKIEKIIFRNGEVMDVTPDLIRMNRRFGVDAGLMMGLDSESAFYIIQTDYFITPGFNLEIAGMVDVEQDGGGLTFGFKYYFNPYTPGKLKGYAGLNCGTLDNDFQIQVPFGVNYVTKNGFDLKLGLSGLYLPGYGYYGLHAVLLLGWRF